MRGFGIGGWLLLPVLAALVYCALGGFDLQHAVIRVMYAWQGEGAVWAVIRWGMAGAYLPSILGVVCGPITLLWVLIAMHVSPRAWAVWQWWVVSAWLIVNPMLCMAVAERIPKTVAGYVGWTLRPPGYVVFVSEVHGVVMAQMAAVCVFVWWGVCPPKRSGRGGWIGMAAPVLILLIGGAIGTFEWWENLRVNMGAAETISGTMWYVLAAVWNVSFAVMAIGAAVVWRRRVAAERERCRGCGYDLRGLRARGGACVRSVASGRCEMFVPATRWSLRARQRPATRVHQGRR